MMIDEVFARFMELDRQMKVAAKEMLDSLTDLELASGLDMMATKKLFEVILSYPPLAEMLEEQLNSGALTFPLAEKALVFLTSHDLNVSWTAKAAESVADDFKDATTI